MFPLAILSFHKKKKRRGLRKRKILGRFSVVHQTFVGSPFSISFFLSFFLSFFFSFPFFF